MTVHAKWSQIFINKIKSRMNLLAKIYILCQISSSFKTEITLSEDTCQHNCMIYLNRWTRNIHRKLLDSYRWFKCVLGLLLSTTKKPSFCCSSINKSQHSSAISTVEMFYDWLRNEQKVCICTEQAFKGNFEKILIEGMMRLF